MKQAYRNSISHRDRHWRKNLIGLFLILMVASSAYVGCVLMSGNGDVSLHETRGWPKEGWLLVRLDTSAPQTVLLRHSNGWPTYRFDANSQAFSPAARDDWDRSETAMTNCLKQSLRSPWPAHIPPSHDLMVGDREIDVAGLSALSLHMAPSGDKVAVVSSAGPVNERPGVFIGGGKRGAWGQHYHQVYSHPDFRLLQQPVRIPVGNKDDLVRGCWSPDEKMVIYTDDQFRFICFVPVILNTE